MIPSAGPGAITAMMVLVICFLMWRHYRHKARCRYCGGEWGKHLTTCPYGGSGMRMPDWPA